jgi:hypothetical protein
MVVTKCSVEVRDVVGFIRISSGWTRYVVLADTIVAQPEEVHPF